MFYKGGIKKENHQNFILEMMAKSNQVQLITFGHTWAFHHNLIQRMMGRSIQVHPVRLGNKFTKFTGDANCAIFSKSRYPKYSG